MPEKKEGMTRHGEEDEESLELFIEVIKRLGMDGVWHSYSVEMQPLKPGFGKDKYGRTYMFSDFGEPLITDAPLKHTNSVKGFADKIKVFSEPASSGISGNTVKSLCDTLR